MNETIETRSTNHLFYGVWKTSRAVTATRITAVPMEKKRVFRITCTELVDKDIARFRFIVDGDMIDGNLSEGGSLFIEGQDIQIEQIDDGENILAIWEVIQEVEYEYYRASWRAYPEKDDEVLLASFSEEKNFVISFNKKSNNCTNGIMNIVIDENVVKDSTENSLQILEGSSIIGRGKHITIKVTGNCSSGNCFIGDIRIQK